MVSFNDVKTILNRAMAASEAKIGHANLQARHKEPSFPNLYGDFTNAQLKAGKARGLWLIQPEVIPAGGTVGDKGDQANIIMALRGLLPNVMLMPSGGPAVADADIATIADWINHGCLD